MAREREKDTARRPRVAFIVQRCGREVNGGAELHCRLIAERMTQHWDVEVLTTCALDYMAWGNHYPAGVEKIGSLAVRRFPVDRPRDVMHFNELSAQLHSRTPDVTIEEQEAWMNAQGPVSSGLFEYIRSAADTYDLFIFFGYLYWQTWFTLPLVAHKAILLPLAHDEWTIHLPMWDRFFELPAHFVFNSEEELGLLRRRFPRAQLEGEIVGIGIDPPVNTDPWRFRQRSGVHVPYLLYVGRIDPSKGCATMFEWFLRAKRTTALPHKLVLIGRPVMPIPDHPDIAHIGFVDEQTKLDAMAGCDWLWMPSEFESLSFVVLETWSVGRPVLVNGKCDVLVGNCRRGSGGVWANSFDDWSAAIGLTSESEKRSLGESGRTFVHQKYSWTRVTSSYSALPSHTKHTSKVGRSYNIS